MLGERSPQKKQNEAACGLVVGADDPRQLLTAVNSGPAPVMQAEPTVHKK